MILLTLHCEKSNVINVWVSSVRNVQYCNWPLAYGYLLTDKTSIFENCPKFIFLHSMGEHKVRFLGMQNIPVTLAPICNTRFGTWLNQNFKSGKGRSKVCYTFSTPALGASFRALCLFSTMGNNTSFHESQLMMSDLTEIRYTH